MLPVIESEPVPSSELKVLPVPPKTISGPEKFIALEISRLLLIVIFDSELILPPDTTFSFPEVILNVVSSVSPSR